MAQCVFNELLEVRRSETSAVYGVIKDLWVAFASKVYAGSMALYGILTLFVWLGSYWISKKTGSETGGSSYLGYVVKRIFLTHGGVALAMYGILWLIDHSVMAKSVKTGDIFVRPFPPAPSLAGDKIPNKDMPTTLPERNDILIGTRYDAEFLASFERFLDFHPGNKRWISMAENVARLPRNLHGPAVQAVVRSLLHDRIKGVRARFLHQDYATGAWRVLPESDAVKETKRAVQMKTDPLVLRIATHPKRYLADARFGIARDTVMARKFRQDFVQEWMPRVFREESTSAPSGRPFCRPGPQSLSLQSPWKQPRLPLPEASVSPSNEYPRSRRTLKSGIDTRDESAFEPGDLVWVNYEGLLYEARIINEFKVGRFGVAFDRYGYSKTGAVDLKDLRKYEAVVEGDRVDVEIHGRNGPEYFEGVVMKVHPDG